MLEFEYQTAHSKSRYCDGTNEFPQKLGERTTQKSAKKGMKKQEQDMSKNVRNREIGHRDGGNTPTNRDRDALWLCHPTVRLAMRCFFSGRARQAQSSAVSTATD